MGYVRCSLPKASDVDLTRTDFASPRQKRTARTMAKPVAPLRIMVVSIALGTFRAAFSISSDI